MINRIEIENFKSIREMDMELKPINILIGANGAGKSNFIGFFKLLKNMYERNLQNYVADEAGAENVLHFGLKHSEYLRGLIEFNVINRYGFILKPNSDSGLFFNEEFNALFSDYVHGKSPVAWHKSFLGNGHIESKLHNDGKAWYKDIKVHLTSFKVFHFHDTSKTGKIKQPCYISDNDFLREDGANLAAYLNALQHTHPKDFKRIEMVIRSVAPYFERFDLKPDRINPDVIRLEWKEKGSDAYFNAKHLSDGTLRFIALTTLLLQPEAPQVIIIDEPELGLHPFAINKFAGLIKKSSANTQIIISTQSVNLVDNFEPEDIITVDRKDGQSVFNRQSSETLKDWLTDYTISDLWNKNVIGGRP
jgi:predicted ATPase